MPDLTPYQYPPGTCPEMWRTKRILLPRLRCDRGIGGNLYGVQVLSGGLWRDVSALTVWSNGLVDARAVQFVSIGAEGPQAVAVHQAGAYPLLAHEVDRNSEEQHVPNRRMAVCRNPVVLQMAPATANPWTSTTWGHSAQEYDQRLPLLSWVSTVTEGADGPDSIRCDAMAVRTPHDPARQLQQWNEPWFCLNPAVVERVWIDGQPRLLQGPPTAYVLSAPVATLDLVGGARLQVASHQATVFKLGLANALWAPFTLLFQTPVLTAGQSLSLRYDLKVL